MQWHSIPVPISSAASKSMALVAINCHNSQPNNFFLCIIIFGVKLHKIYFKCDIVFFFKMKAIQSTGQGLTHGQTDLRTHKPLLVFES